MDIASEDTHYEEKKASSGHSDSIHHSSHLAALSSKPSATNASQGAKAKSSSNTISLPAPQKPPKEASQALPSVGTVPPACTAALPSSHSKVNSSHYLHPAQILEPGGLGSSGQWNMMRPQKGIYQLTSKPQVRHRAERVTWADLLEEHLGEIETAPAPGGVHLCQ
uniref:Uncharacterized protein n=1 Tax=Castor canadensis TaxID=51338 RepID=A0A8C0WL71_CASCN